MSFASTARHHVAVAAALFVTLGVSSAALANPNLLGAWQTKTGVGLMWTSGDSNVSSYRIYRKTGATGYWRYLRPVAVNGSFYIQEDTDTPVGEELCYMIGARITGQWRLRLSNSRCITPASAPTRPTDVRLDTFQTQQVTVQWTDSSTNEVGFRVQRRRWGVDPAWTDVHSAPANGGVGTRFEFDDTDVDMEYRTCYRVGARSSVGSTVWASMQCVDVPGLPVYSSADEAVVLRNITSPGTGAIRVQWTANDMEAEHSVERALVGYWNWKTVVTARDHTSRPAGALMSHTDSGLDPGRVYCYRVRVRGGQSNLMCTSAFERTGGRAPSAVDGRTMAVSNRGVEHEWSVPADALGAFTIKTIEQDGNPTFLIGSDVVGAGSYADTFGYLQPDTEYCFTVVTYNRFGISTGAPSCVRTLNSVPERPDNIRVVDNREAIVTFAWDSILDADRYEFRWTGRRVGFAGNDGSTVTRRTLYDLPGRSGFRYCGQVRAVNGAGASAWSGEVCQVASELTSGGGGGVPNRLSVCSLTCPAGYHPVRHSAEATCGSVTYLNHSDCVEDSSRFVQCGTSCAAGYHAVSYSDSSSCDVADVGNRVRESATCSENAGTFSMCDTNCPSGWHVTQTSRAPTCRATDYDDDTMITCSPN